MSLKDNYLSCIRVQFHKIEIVFVDCSSTVKNKSVVFFNKHFIGKNNKTFGCFDLIILVKRSSFKLVSSSKNL